MRAVLTALTLLFLSALSLSAQVLQTETWCLESRDTLTTFDRDTYEEIIQIVASYDTFRRHTFRSVHIGERLVDVWIPSDYRGERTHTPYSVLYMHDGQMLFDHRHTWNRQSWNAHETAGRLIRNQKTAPFLIVGIHSIGERRHADYFPQKPFEAMPAKAQRKLSNQVRMIGRSKGRFVPDSDDYLRFLVEELKPFIDSTYPVNGDRDHTYIAGSSMGGLISLYALCEYPGTFGSAACISTHWPGSFTVKDNPFPAAMREYLRDHLPPPMHHRLWFDHGDHTLGALYPPLQAEVDSLLREKGYGPDLWITKPYPGTDHSEKAWSQRLEEILVWLVRK